MSYVMLDIYFCVKISFKSLRPSLPVFLKVLLKILEKKRNKISIFSFKKKILVSNKTAKFNEKPHQNPFFFIKMLKLEEKKTQNKMNSLKFL